MATGKDTLVGEVAVDRGYITQAQLDEAREAHRKVQALGVDQPLLEILVGKHLLTPDQAQEVTKAVAIKTGEARLVAGFEVVAKLGQGGMGVVYKARNVDTGEFVALKILPPSLASTDYVARFRREADIVSGLQHDNIVSFLEYGYDDRRKCWYCALELVEGEDLGTRLKRDGALSEDEAVAIVFQVAQALQHASFHNLVHRDVKPENIMVTPDGTAKLLDLGLARPANLEATRVTQSGIFLGSPYYVSPEQATGEKTLDIRSDIYSLGATLYHCVTGKPPFGGTTVMQVLQKHISEQLPWPADVNPALSDGLCCIITKMMAKAAADRYQKPTELLQDLDMLAHGSEVEIDEAVLRRSSISLGAVPRSARPRRPAGAALPRARERAARRRRREEDAAAEARASGMSPAVKQIIAVGAGAFLVMLLGVVLLTGGRKEPADKGPAAGRPGDAPPALDPPPLAFNSGSGRGDAAGGDAEAKSRRVPAPAPAGRSAVSPGKSSAASALREARAYEKAHPRDRLLAIARYETVARDFPGTAEAAIAQVCVARLKEGLPPPAPAPPPAGVPPDAVAFGGHRYKLYAKTMTWHDARRFCEELGGHLVTITSKEENDFVTALARRSGASAWIGLTDEREEGTWEWVTGEALSLNAWGPTEPNGGREENFGAVYLAYNYGGRWFWNDATPADPNIKALVCEWEPGWKPPAPVPPDITRGLVGHWTFDEGQGALAADSSGKGNDGRLVGGPRWTRGPVGGALQLDGTGQYVDCGSRGSLDLTVFTVTGWFRTSDKSGFRCIFSKNTSASDRNWWVSIRQGTGSVGFKTGPERETVDLDSGRDFADGRWHFFAAVLDGTRGARLCVDGAEVAASQGPLRPPPKVATAAVIGNDPSEVNRYLNGAVDDVRIYQRVLTAEEIGALAALGGIEPPATPPPDITRGLVAHWKFDEGQGTTARDSSGRGRDGAVKGGARWVAGRIGGALAFDGKSGHVEVGSVGVSGAAPRTIAGWARASTTVVPSWATVFGFSNASAAGGTYFDVTRDQAGEYCLHVCGPDYDVCPVDLLWHHFAATYDGASISVFLDGSLVARPAGRINTTDQVMIGRRLDTEAHFPGAVDDVRIYDRALAPEEVALLADHEKLAALDAAKAEAEERQEKLGEMLAEFDALLGKGDFAGAKARVERVAVDAGADDVPVIMAAMQLADALAARRKAACEAASWRKGKTVRLRMRTRVCRGVLKEVDEQRIVVLSSYRIGGEEREKLVTIPWGDLALDQEEELVAQGGWKPAGASAAVARAYSALARGRAAAAEDALRGASGHALLPHARSRVEALKKSFDARRSAAAKPPAPRVRADKPKWPPDAATVRELFRGRLARWNPRTFEIELFYDFEDARQIGDWSLSTWALGNAAAPNMSVAAGALRLSGTGRYARLSSPFLTMSVRADFAATAGAGTCALLVCADRRGGFYNQFGILGWRNALLETYSAGRPAGHLSPAKPSPFAAARAGSMSLSFANGVLRGQVGNLRFDGKDTRHASGRVGLWAPGTDATFDNVHVRGQIDPEWLKIRLGLRPPPGLLGTYFAGMNLATPVLRRVDPDVDFDWGAMSPAPEMPADNFSVRWEGTLVPEVAGTHTFTLASDDGSRLWLGGRLIVNGWARMGTHASTGVRLEKGGRHPLRVEFREGGGAAYCRLLWTGPGNPTPVPVPSACLLPPKDYAKLPGPPLVE